MSVEYGTKWEDGRERVTINVVESPPLVRAQDEPGGGWTSTGDGGPCISVWHRSEVDGEPSGDEVYYERYNLAGLRLAHGWIDRTSRKIVQTG